MADIINLAALGKRPDMSAITTPLLEYLAAEGYRAALDDDGDISFKHEGLHFSLCFDSDDPLFAKLVLPNVWTIDSDAEHARVLAALDDVNRRLKVAKGHTVNDRAWLCIELWVLDQQHWTTHLPRALRTLTHALGRFAAQMNGVAESSQS